MILISELPVIFERSMRRKGNLKKLKQAYFCTDTFGILPLDGMIAGEYFTMGKSSLDCPRILYCCTFLDG
jgi:hypothetical protein